MSHLRDEANQHFHEECDDMVWNHGLFHMNDNFIDIGCRVQYDWNKTLIIYLNKLPRTTHFEFLRIQGVKSKSNP